MQVIADTRKLVADGIITPEQALQMQSRSRDAMITLAINTILCFGILAATGGLIFWLANAAAVAVCGLLFLGVGVMILYRSGDEFGMFGNAAALIGAGMLLGGAGIELVENYPDMAGVVMILLGAVAAIPALIALRRSRAQFVAGAIFLMGILLHLAGLWQLLYEAGITGAAMSAMYLYTAAALVLAGWLTDVRLITALAIVPFAQMLDTGTFYMHAMYAFYSPESTLSILQMALLMLACLWVSGATTDRTSRHSKMLGLMAFIVANLCALVGSLWGDVIGETVWGPGRYRSSEWDGYSAYEAARDAFRENAVEISEALYSIFWALALVGMVLFAVRHHRRGLLNTALTFGAIHAYTQLFESFGEEPAAWVVGGLAAIPVAWGLWRVNQVFSARQAG